MKYIKLLVCLGLMSSCFARTTESDKYKTIQIEPGISAKIYRLGTFVNREEKFVKNDCSECLQIDRPDTEYQACEDNDIKNMQTEIRSIIFETVDTLLNTSVDNIDDFTHGLFRMFHDEFDTHIPFVLSVNIESMELSINLTDSIFRVIAHQAINCHRHKNHLETPLLSQFMVDLKPIFDVVKKIIHENPDGPKDLVQRVTTAEVKAHIDRIYA